MVERGRRELLSVGVLLLIIVFSILLHQPLQVVADWMLTIPLIIALAGCWTIILAAMQASNPQKYERGAFSIFSWGLLLASIGGAWFLYAYAWVYSLIVILLALAAIAIVAAAKRK